ncbi:unnamed protein product [Ectocarpus sp. 12 AP-2014]
MQWRSHFLFFFQEFIKAQSGTFSVEHGSCQTGRLSFVPPRIRDTSREMHDFIIMRFSADIALRLVFSGSSVTQPASFRHMPSCKKHRGLQRPPRASVHVYSSSTPKTHCDATGQLSNPKAGLAPTENQEETNEMSHSDSLGLKPNVANPVTFATYGSITYPRSPSRWDSTQKRSLHASDLIAPPCALL